MLYEEETPKSQEMEEENKESSSSSSEEEEGEDEASESETEKEAGNAKMFIVKILYLHCVRRLLLVRELARPHRTPKRAWSLVFKDKISNCQWPPDIKTLSYVRLYLPIPV